MRYFLKNIAQDSMLRTILLVVLGIAMWIPNLVSTTWGASETPHYKWGLWVTLILTIVNSLLITHALYKGRGTNLPSPFVGSTYWFAMSAIPYLHSGWQTQLLVTGALLIYIVILNIQYQHEATEEAFLATLICCFFAPFHSAMLAGIMMIWGYLIFKGLITWRVWLASLIAIAVRVVLMLTLHLLGWMEWLWLENIPRLAWLQWGIFASVFLVASLMILLPIRKPSTASGILYVVCTTLLTLVGGYVNGKLLLTTI